MTGLAGLLKYNRVSVGLYDWLLERRCREVEAYIFVATTGRSGSESLSKIFQAADRAVCFHEPYPLMYADYPNPSHKSEYFRSRFYGSKRINIKRAAAGNRYYVETNHQFIKNYADHAIAHFGDKIRVIHMVREPVKVAASFYAIDSIPGTSKTGKHYLLYPEHDDNLIQIADLLYDDPEFSHDLYKCLWYWYEIESRIKSYMERYPSVRWHTIRTDQLNDEPSLVDLFETLGIRYDADALKSLVGSRENTKSALKKQSVDLVEAEEMHQKLRAALAERFGDKFNNQYATP